MRLTSKSAIITAAGVVLLGTSLALSSAGVVFGSSPPGQIQHDASCSSSSACLTESNTGSGGGIRGTAKGKNSAGVNGAGSGFDGIGVLGKGTGSGGTGIEGTGYVGVYGVANNEGAAVAAYNTCTSVCGTGITSQVSSVYGMPLETFGCCGSSAGDFSVDAAGDGVFEGFVQADGGFTMAIRGRAGQVRASVPLAPRATVEDTGTARMTAGVGVVHLQPDFASTLDMSQGYQVFLTPDGDTRGLYIAQKYENGFVVRENEHGRSSVYFDYRVVAHPAGSSAVRFPTYNQTRRTLRPPAHVPPPSGS